MKDGTTYCAVQCKAVQRNSVRCGGCAREALGGAVTWSRGGVEWLEWTRSDAPLWSTPKSLYFSKLQHTVSARYVWSGEVNGVSPDPIAHTARLVAPRGGGATQRVKRCDASYNCKHN